MLAGSTDQASLSTRATRAPVAFVRENEAKVVLLVRSIERADGGRLLTEEQRRRASTLVRDGLPHRGRTLSDVDWVEKFLVPRAQLLLLEVAARHQGIRRVLAAPAAQSALFGVLLVGAFLAGLLAERIPNADRINMLSLPLIGIVLWNWCCFAVWGAVTLRSQSPESRAGRRRLMVVVARFLAWTPRTRSWLANVVNDYLVHWVESAASLIQSRLNYVLHLSAAAVAVGAVASLAWGAWQTEYRVGWASTLCNAPECAHAVHSLIYSPTRPLSTYIGAAPFSVNEIKELHRWQRPDDGQGERWFRLTAALLVVTVIVPRVLLAMRAKWRAKRLSARFHLDLSDEYFAELRVEPVPPPHPTLDPTSKDGKPAKSKWKRFFSWPTLRFRRRVVSD